jgi:hypothetical protein
MCDSIEPRPQPVGVANRPSTSNEHEKRRLERVFNQVRVAQQPPTDGQDHRPMPGHQCLERGLVPPRHESLKELALVEAGDGSRLKQPA